LNLILIRGNLILTRGNLILTKGNLIFTGVSVTETDLCVCLYLYLYYPQILGMMHGNLGLEINAFMIFLTLTRWLVVLPR